MTSNPRRIAIVGGGAAGLAAAVAAGLEARQTLTPANICLFEGDPKVGRPILRSGNGRCNFSNAQVSAAAYRQLPTVASGRDEAQEFAAQVLDQLPPAQVWEFFQQLGLAWTQEGDGRLYPATGKATTVLDVLRHAALALGVHEHCDTPIVRIEPPREPGKPWTLIAKDGAFHRADAVIVAIGGHDGTGCLPPDIPIVAPRPVLGPLAASPQLCKPLDNIRAHATISLLDGTGHLKAQETGEVLFRKYGVSGIAVFNLSRYAQKGDTLSIDLLPNQQDAAGMLTQRAQNALALNPQATIGDALCGLVLPLIAQCLFKVAGIDANLALARIKASTWRKLADALTGLPLQVQGIGDVKTCQVSRGGIALSAVDVRSLQAASHPNLYLVGELLNIDAPCGGYNLHWAWTTGIIAGRRAVGQQ